MIVSSSQSLPNQTKQNFMFPQFLTTCPTNIIDILRTHTADFDACFNTHKTICDVRVNHMSYKEKRASIV